MTPLVIVAGATGYVGQVFVAELKRRGHRTLPISRSDVDYTRFDRLLEFLQAQRPAFLINAAGYTGKPNVDACELARGDTLVGNTLLPQTIAQACDVAQVPWGHVSSGCIFSGAKVLVNGTWQVEKDLTRPNLRALVDSSPESIRGFTEEDTPNFTFRNGPCSFYSGTKALGEEAILNVGRSYIWRLRIPFDEFDSPRNYLTKVQRYAKVYDNTNSISHRLDFVRACLDTWELGAPFGIYNVTNPGFITTRHVIDLIEKQLRPARKFEFWANDEEFYKVAAKTPRSNCVMDVSKLLNAGVKIRPVEEALEHSLRNWRPEQSL